MQLSPLKIFYIVFVGVNVCEVRIITQILDIVCFLANFNPISLDFLRHVFETKQYLKARFSQHRRPSSSEHQADSAIYEHTKRSGHSIDSEDIIILDREERWFKRVVREAIWETLLEQTRGQTMASIWVIIPTLFYDWMIDSTLGKINSYAVLKTSRVQISNNFE